MTGDPAADDKVPVFGAPTKSVAIPVSTTRKPRSNGVRNSQHYLNGGIAFLLVLVVLIVPVPLGSNRPAFWGIWGVTLGALGCVYALGLWISGDPARIRLRAVWPELLLFVLLCSYLVFQCLPIGRWAPQSIVAQDGTRLPMNSFSLDPGSTWLELIQFGTLGLVFFLVLQVAANRRRARRMLWTLTIGIAAYAAYGLISLTYLDDTILGFAKTAYQGFATGTFVNRNSFATFLAIGGMGALSLLMDALAGRQATEILQLRLLRLAAALVCLGFIVAALLATGSRMGVFSAVVGATLTLFVGLLVMRTSARIMVISALLTAAVGVLLFIYFGSDLLGRFVAQAALEDGRSVMHPQIWGAIQARPLLGYGGGSFASVFPMFQGPSGASRWENTHSTYLALWFELGLIAGSIPILIVFLLIIRSLATAADRSSAALSIAAVGAATVIAVHSLLDFSAEIFANAVLLTAFLALAAAGAGKRSRTSDNGIS